MGSGDCDAWGYTRVTADSRSMGIPSLQLVITAEAEVIPAEVVAQQAEATAEKENDE